jgi:Protein of unknown function (DUF3175)
MASEESRRRWSAKVTQTSDALDLEGDIFKSRSARRVAASLEHSAEHSHRRKTSPFQSAMSMLNFTSTVPAGTSRHRARRCWRLPSPSCAGRLAAPPLTESACIRPLQQRE